MKKIMLFVSLMCANYSYAAFQNAELSRNASLENRPKYLQEQKERLINGIETTINQEISNGNLKAVYFTGMNVPFRSRQYPWYIVHETILYFRGLGYDVSAFGGFLAPEGLLIKWEDKNAKSEGGHQ